MSVALVNPPYDYDAATGLRTEFSTLQRLTPWLISHGVLILIIQDRQLPTVWPFIATHYHVQHIFRFPDPEWAQFEQIVLLASDEPHLSTTIRTRQERDDYARSFRQPRLRSQASWETPPFPERPGAAIREREPWAIYDGLQQGKSVSPIHGETAMHPRWPPTGE